MKKKSKTSGYIIRSSAGAMFFLGAFIAFSPAFNSPNGWYRSATAAGVYDTTAKTSGQARALTFAERIAFQRVIEEVYWRHRIWPKSNPGPKPSLEAVISQAQLEQKVEDYLRNSQALEDYWQRPITTEQLQAEMDRMAGDTKQPEVLRELFEALGNHPFVVAECLARPVLTERLLSNLSAQDETRDVGSPQTNVLRTMPVATTLGQVAYTLPRIADTDDTPCADDTWTAMTTTNAPSARSGHTAVWTGSEMIVWGGMEGYDVFNTGGRYYPSTDSWTSTSITNAPSTRAAHTAVWDGSEMIIWGGGGGSGQGNTGGKYNPVTDSWTSTSTTSAPEARGGHTAVWIGSEMIVWGGSSSLYGAYFNTGGRYNPGTNSWTATSIINAPAARGGHRAVWTGSKMIIWGGFFIDSNGHLHNFDSGGSYHPATNSWVATSTTNAPTGRVDNTAVWTGSEMIIWGGSFYDSHYNQFELNTGGRYNPDMNSWTPTSTVNAPSPRSRHTAVWDGSEMIIWGGEGGLDGFLNTGGRYNPATNGWTATSTTNVPRTRDLHTAVWTGSEMIVWGGVGNTGGRYCAQFETGGARALVADFNGDGHPDYVVQNASTHQTAIWYLNNNVFVRGAYGPTLPAGWQLVAAGDFNRDGKPDCVLFNASTLQTAIWCMNNNVFVSGLYGPTLASGWSLVGLADFDHDGKLDYLLFKSSTRQSAIWYLNNNVLVRGAYGPTITSGYILPATADFNRDGRPDYVLYNASIRRTAIWYLHDNVYVSGAYGPTLPTGWSLGAP